MKIDCYFSEGCASEAALRENLSRALELEQVKADVKFRTLTDAEAVGLGLKGSPSILINGKDMQPANIYGFS